MLPGFSGTRQWVYPKTVQGRFQRIHRSSGLLMQLFLVLTPWLTLGELPVVRIDLPDRRLYLLGTVFTAADGRSSPWLVFPWRTVLLLLVAVPLVTAAVTATASALALRVRPVRVSTMAFE